MGNFLKKHFILITILFLVVFALSAWKFPSAAPLIGMIFLCSSLGIAIFSIVVKHRSAYGEGRLTRFAFLRNVFLDVSGVLLAVVLAALLGRYAADLVAQQIDGAVLRFAAGMLVGVLVGISVGLLVRGAWGRFVKTTPSEAVMKPRRMAGE
ncbi:MAG: hypothetical protein JW730_16300 [Anaerolineales bacterium]|nr:hypothetical protein [Anaerolineales bacterium]